jgi:hypothetical protein
MELEFEVLLDLVLGRVSEQELAEIAAEITEHGRRQLPELLMRLDRSRDSAEPERAAQVRVLARNARSGIRTFVATPKVTAARECVLTLEELAQLVLYTERWPLEELRGVGAGLAHAIRLCLSAEPREQLAFAVDQILFDELVGRENPRRLGQFGPRDWNPVYQAIRPSRWELEPAREPSEVPTAAPSGPRSSPTEVERKPHGASPEGDPIEPAAASTRSDAGGNGGNPGGTGQEGAGTSGGKRDPRAISVGPGSIVKGGPGRPATSAEVFWSGGGVPW